MRLVIREYLKGVLQRKLAINAASAEEANDVLGDLGEHHTRAMAAGQLDMIEIEFRDEPDPLKRFFRIGTNPDLMVNPIEIVVT